MKRISISDRIRYAFDNTMSKGTIALIGWLALLSAVVVLIISVIVWILKINSEVYFLDQIWTYIMVTLEASDTAAGPWSLRLTSLALVLTSIFVISTLIGVLTSGIEGKIEELQKGRSKVIEVNHTVILGWTEQVFSIISELVVANSNQKKPRIVVLGGKDKVEMEDEIRNKVGPTGNTKVICRSGNPMEPSDLDISSLKTSKSIIILSPDDGDPDSTVIKTLLAVTNDPNRRQEPYHIVAEIQNPRNLEVARIAGRDEVESILTGDLIARIAAQTCRQSGLSVVYTELLDFGGDEIYFQEEPTLVGKVYGDALTSYEDSAIFGIRSKDGPLSLNPPMDTIIRKGDQMIAISEDDETVRVSDDRNLGVDTSLFRTSRSIVSESEHTLILGWNWRAPLIIRELDHYVARGSTIRIVTDLSDAQASLNQICESLENQSCSFQHGDTTDRHILEELALEDIDRVILIPYADIMDKQHADARTLITLLHLRDISDIKGYGFSIVSEMLDIRNRNLAEITRADDFIVSDRLISLILSQISENKELSAVFADLFDPEGSEIYLKPASNYVALGVQINFYTIIESAKLKGETAIGYRKNTDALDANESYGVKINPQKSKYVVYEEEDKIIVLAEG